MKKLSTTKNPSPSTASSALGRRQFLLGTAAFTALLGTSHAAATPRPASRAKNIIFLVSDGMSLGVLDLTAQFSRLVRERDSEWVTLMNHPGVVNGLQETHSASSLVTDSAAAASAWGCGQRIPNGSINTLADGRTLTPISSLIKKGDRKLGLVTTATATHATPAGFAAQVPERKLEATIAEQYLDAGVDVILGGGTEFFDPSLREDGRDLFSAFEAQGYGVHRSAESLASANTQRLLGIFHKGHLPYTIDQTTDGNSTVPTLAAMTRAALPALTSSPRGFLLQVEAARVDHAAHNNDAAALLHDQLAFEDALRVALDFAQADGETLVIVTSDHGNANPGLNGHGARYDGSTSLFEHTTKATRSHEWILAQLKDSPPPADAAAKLIHSSLGFLPSDNEIEALLNAAQTGKTEDWSTQQTNFMSLLGRVSGNHNGIGWTGVTHTSDHTLTTALGPGAAAFAGVVPNHTYFDILRETLALPSA